MSNSLSISVCNNCLKFSDNKVTEHLNHNLLVSILRKALVKQESDLQHWVARIKKYTNGHQLWAATWIELRQDDLVGLNWYYFLEELIRSIRKSFFYSQIIVKASIPRTILKYLNTQLDDVVFTNPQSKMQEMKSLLSPLKLVKAWANLSQKADLVSRGYWLSSPLNANNHRYRDLLEKLNDRPMQFFHANHHLSVNTHKKAQALNFSVWEKSKDWIKALRHGLRLRKVVMNSKCDSLLMAFLHQLKAWHFAGMSVREQWIERAMIELQPKAIFFTTAVNYSPARLISRVAFQQNIPFYIVACRPMFTNLRMEERSIRADHEKVNDAHVADGFIVWDEFSRKTLLSQGFSEEQIYLYQNSNKPDNIELKLSNRCLILFTHDKGQNDALINLFEEVKPNGDWAIRTHPLQPLTGQQKKRLELILGSYLDISNEKMNAIDFDKVIAISINSTAAVEACSLGAGVLWLPFLNFRSIVFDEVMSILGEKAYSSGEFKQLIEQYQLDMSRTKFIEVCQQQYREHFIGHDNFDLFLEKLKT